MPLRSEVLAKRWSTANLPILPFLAPSVFQPWPSSRGRSRRTHSSVEAKRASSNHDASNYDSQPSIPRVFEGAPDVVLGSKESGKSRSRGVRVNQRGWTDGVPISTRDAAGNAKGIDADGTVGTPVVLEEPLDSIPTESPGRWSIQRRGDGFVPMRSIQYRESGSQPIGKDVLASPKSPVSPAMKLASQDAVSHGLVSCRPTTDTNQKKNAKDSFFYWRNIFGNINTSSNRFPTKKLGHRRNTDHNLKRRFISSHLNQLYQEDIHQLWDDLVRLDHGEFENLWDGLTEKSRVRLWPGLMLNALPHHPHEALKLLTITYTDVLPPDYAISDALDFLISRCLAKQRGATAGNIAGTAMNAYDMQNVVAKWMRLHDRVRISQKSIYTLSLALGGEQLRQFYQVLSETKQYLFPHTSIQLASRLAKADLEHVELSFSILKGLYGRINFDHPAVMSLCTTILHRSQQIPDARSTVAEKFQVMLGLGMKVNIVIYNVLIQNAVRSGDPETAWKIHGMMLENETEPDDYTYSILLNDAKWRMDSAAIRSVMGYLSEKDIGGVHLHTDLLHLIFLLHQNEEQLAADDESEFVQRSRRREAFDKMLGKYCEKFHIEPLGNLIPNFSKDFPHASSNPASSLLVDPPAPTLAVMLTGLLYSLDSAATKELYDRFIGLIGTRDPFALLAASNVYVWNAFLMSFGRFHERLNDCPKVIKAMISSREKSKEQLTLRTLPSSNSDQPDLLGAEPDVFTWSILLQIFTKHNQLRAAEKVITAMQSRGTLPNEVTWTTLAFGYSRMQDVEKMADTIHRMEKGGLEVVDRTVVAMAGINDREGLARALNRRKTQQNTEMNSSAAEASSAKDL